MFVLGITGGIGSGKSTVSSILADRGLLVLDADEISRSVTGPMGRAMPEIAETFGVNVGVTKQDTINAVEDMLCDEYALEFAFEGTRFYDLARLARHKNEAGLYSANFGMAATLIKRDDLKISKLTADECIAELTKFAMSDEYSRLRGRLNIKAYDDSEDVPQQ